MKGFESKQFNLREDRPNVKLESFCASVDKERPFNAKRKAILVIPGGAYWMCSSREGEPIALYYLARGFNTFVLTYSVYPNAKYPEPLIDASLAMKFIKDHAEEFCIDPEYVYAIGFSAGGHLAGLLATSWHEKAIYDRIDMPYGYNKPRGVILSYPVITSYEKAHRGSINNILGMSDSENADPELLDMVCLDKKVDDKTCPAFIWHTATDNVVPVQNSLMMAEKLADNKIPFELHIYPKGSHGLSLADETVGVGDDPIISRTRAWIEDSIKWMKSI
ncbi:MAG: alpha/beta hydrolase [Clostridia bacterium]|nr:alpha/beta hydrolase [Clostridia bacterium]